MRHWMLLPLVAACRVPLDEPGSRPDWARDIGPLVEERCAGCHAEGRIAGDLPLQTYDQAAPLAARMLDEVHAGRMPPWPAQQTDWCPTPFAFRGDLRLTSDEIALLEAWVDGGLVEGTKTGRLEPPDDVRLPGANQILEVPPFEVEPDGEDDYVCAVLDPGLDGDGWLEGVAVAPGQTDVVHHAGVRIVGAGAQLEDDVYMCSAGVGVPAQYVGTYAPGSGPSEAPPDSAMYVPAGSRIVLNFHYHPLADRSVVDRSELHLRWSARPPVWRALLDHWPSVPETPLVDVLEPGPFDRSDTPELYIPAGVRDHTETLSAVLRGDPDQRYEVWQVASHMHLAGVEGRIWVEHADGTTECLLHIPRWDFEWQRMYRYEPGTGPVVRGGDRVFGQCTYDNTMENADLAVSLQDRGLDGPVDITLGPSTFDEMCMFMVGHVPIPD